MDMKPLLYHSRCIVTKKLKDLGANQYHLLEGYLENWCCHTSQISGEEKLAVKQSTFYRCFGFWESTSLITFGNF